MRRVSGKVSNIPRVQGGLRKGSGSMASGAYLCLHFGRRAESSQSLRSCCSPRVEPPPSGLHPLLLKTEDIAEPDLCSYVPRWNVQQSYTKKGHFSWGNLEVYLPRAPNHSNSSLCISSMDLKSLMSADSKGMISFSETKQQLIQILPTFSLLFQIN